MNLGQVYTKNAVAEYIVSLLTLPDGARILDPCFGTGAFVEALVANGRFVVEGVEVDEDSFTSYENKNTDRCSLSCRDFFTLDEKDKFDGVIMNPPYVRQEEIDKMREKYGVCKDRLKRLIGVEIDSKANLYMYFLLYALKLLKDEGELVVIFPNSWEKARSGVKFRKALAQLCRTELHINVVGTPFEGDPVVDVEILKLKKTRRDIETQFKQITVDGDEVTEETLSDKSQIDYVNAVPLSWFAQVRRGKSTGCNKVFINPQIMSTQCQKEILSSPKQVAGFTTNGAKTDKYLLITSEKTELDAAVKDYLEQSADCIRKKQEPKSLYEQIQQTPYWYVTNDIGTGDIVFPYIIRDTIRFILNDKKLLARDNFYCINSVIDKYLLMALLNNHFVWLQLEKCGKTYGNNVLKIQKYDVDDLMIISPEIISAEDKETLKRLAKDLAETSDTENIGKITEMLGKYYNIENIEELLNEARNKRLNK